MNKTKFGRSLRLDRQVTKALLGYFEPGSVPTIVRHDDQSFLTASHEGQHHADLANTYFGFLLCSQLDIVRSKRVNFLKRWSARQGARRQLAEGWQVLEGSAVLTEYLVLLHLGKDAKALKDELPRSYLKAFKPFEAFVDLNPLGLPIDQASVPTGFVFLRCFFDAITELALDWNIISHPNNLANHKALMRMSGRTTPSANLRMLLERLPTLSLAKVPDLIAAARSSPKRLSTFTLEGSEEILNTRLQTIAAKMVIAAELGAPIEATRLLSDRTRGEVFQKLRNELEVTQEGLTPRPYRLDYIGEGVRFDFISAASPLVKLTGEMVDAATLVTYCHGQVAQIENHIGTTIVVLPTKSDEVAVELQQFAAPANPNRGVVDFYTHTLGALMNHEEFRTVLTELSHLPLALVGCASLSYSKDEYQYWQDFGVRTFVWHEIFHERDVRSFSERAGTAAVYTVRRARLLPVYILEAQSGKVTYFWVTSILVEELVKKQGGWREGEIFFQLVDTEPDSKLGDCAFTLAIHRWPEILSMIRKSN